MDTSASITELPYKGSLTPRKSVWALINPTLFNKTPRWVKYYPIAAYITFGVNLVVVFAYLIYLGLILNQRKMYMRYKWVTEFHEMNSYSLLSPFMAFPIVGVMSYHVKNKKNLIDGDFLGILGVVLLMAGISVYDATKLIYLTRDLDEIVNHNDPLKQKEAMAFLDVFKNSSRIIVQNWTHHLQSELKCCGVQSYRDWVKFPREEIPWSCCCDAMENCKNCTVDRAYKQGCGVPFWNFLISIYIGTSVCMLILALAFVFTMIAYIFHWAAMQIDNGAYTMHDDNHPLSLSNYDPNDNVQDNKRASRINRVRHRSVGPGNESSAETLELFVISAPKNRGLSTDAGKGLKNMAPPEKQQQQQQQTKQQPVPPAVGSIQSQPPIVGSNQAQPPIVGSNQAQPPIVGSNQAQPPIVGSNQAQPPIVGSNQAQPPNVGSNQAQHPHKLLTVGSNQAQQHLQHPHQPPTAGSAQHQPQPPENTDGSSPPGATKSWFW